MSGVELDPNLPRTTDPVDQNPAYEPQTIPIPCEVALKSGGFLTCEAGAVVHQPSGVLLTGETASAEPDQTEIFVGFIPYANLAYIRYSIEALDKLLPDVPEEKDEPEPAEPDHSD